MTTQVYYITATAQFNRLLIQLKQSALVNESPAIYRVGFDLEYITSNQNAKWVYNTVKNRISCVVQIATDDVCFVINLTKLGPQLPAGLVKIITNSNWVKLGVGIDDDMKLLAQNYNLGHCGGSYELQTLASIHKLPKPSLQTLAEQYLTLNIRKHLHCDWSGELNAKHIKYAAIDAIVSYRLGSNALKFAPTSVESTLQFDLNIPKTETSVKPVGDSNYVGQLQEFAVENDMKLPTYVEHLSDGNFTVECQFDGKTTSGTWLNKKNAKKIAAGKMCQLVLKTDVKLDVGTKVDYISKLNLHHQANNNSKPIYTTIKTNVSQFGFECTYLGQTTRGDGSNTKIAKNNAAEKMWQMINSD